ncbi:hypothetical protein [Campylobacter devanensis]|nr:hypothetical protein [Campylobacter sp. P148]
MGLNLAFCVAFLGLGGEFLWCFWVRWWNLDTTAEFDNDKKEADSASG